MRKSLLAISICLISAMLLAGCAKASENKLKDEQAGVREETADAVAENSREEVKSEKKEENTDKIQDETAYDEAGYKTRYAPVLDEVLEVIDRGPDIDRDYKYVSDGLSEKIMYSKDGRPTLTATGSTRSSYRYMDNGHFYYEGSGGVSITIFGENHLSNDGCGLVWDDFYFSDEKENGEVGVYYNNTGIFGVEDSEELDMSEEEFRRKMSGYQDRCEMIPWTPVGNYRTGNGDDPDFAGAFTGGGHQDPGELRRQDYYGVFVSSAKSADACTPTINKLEEAGFTDAYVKCAGSYTGDRYGIPCMAARRLLC